ncbi:MAG TPA: BNR-4 repeat-containing protein [Tepidisphaeraceae bacterium]|jgi:hypothetical protein
MLSHPVDPASLLVVNDNAGWCWFQNERAIIANDQLIFASAANVDGAGGEARSGNIELTQYDLTTGRLVRSVLHHQLEGDDHNVPALHLRQDKRIVAVYTKHGSDKFKRLRVSKHPLDVSDMEPETALEMPAGVCYSNVYRVPAENGRVYDFTRAVGWNPNYNVSDDDGLTWRYGGRLLNWPKPAGDPKFTGMDGGRPYVRYASNGRDAVHLITTEDHPRGYDNSIYHAVVHAGQVLASDGTTLAPLSTTEQTDLRPNQLTRVFEGDADNVPWTADIRVDAAGLPYIAFSVQKNDGKNRTDSSKGGDDLRYYYGRFDGKKWHVHPLAHAGHRLYAAENDYAGLVALHPYRPDVVYLSTSADPKTGQPLISRADGKRHYELYRGITPDGGANWSFTALTADSTTDNLRPIVPPGNSKRTIVLWCRGTLTTYTRYNLQAVMVEDPL